MDETNLAEIRRRVFEGVAPVRFTLDSLDVPLCFNVPRCISLGAFVYRQLGYFITDRCPDLWFEHDNRALKWYLPVGCIYDALCPSEGPVESLSVAIHKEGVDKQKDVIRCESAEATASYFCQSFKESMFLTEGNILPSQETTHQRIEMCVRNKDYESFSEIFPSRFKTFGSWKIWPIKFIGKDLSVHTAFLPVDGTDQTIKDAMALARVEGESVLVHGVKIDVSAKLTELMPVLLSPDGFFYANLI